MTPSFNSVVKLTEAFFHPLVEARASTLIVITTLFCIAISLNWLPLPGFLDTPMVAITIIAMLGILATVTRLISMGLHHLIDGRRARRAAEQQTEIESARLAQQEALLPSLITDMSVLHRHITEALLFEDMSGGYMTVDIHARFEHNNHHELDFMKYLVALDLATNTPHPSYRNGVFRPTEKLKVLFQEHLVAER